ncbi:hypothetical protein LOAG_13560 [Loa loa]|uniref:Uncharacterized protein n=1 Tax=Loa loa TaxID=7209 RepID=A0A1S0TJA9_LOALO|nr:hypothetical protein LOAG_13560 [Loa loa]EFO14955.1 hypothetical protein LOAG_13560 [Loa loa]
MELGGQRRDGWIHQDEKERDGGDTGRGAVKAGDNIGETRVEERRERVDAKERGSKCGGDEVRRRLMSIDVTFHTSDLIIIIINGKVQKTKRKSNPVRLTDRTLIV